jgi:hypothetical protein
MKMLSLDRYTFKKNREANLQLSLPRVASANHRLSDGFKVDWEQRQKARPLLLRLIQTFFGN